MARKYEPFSDNWFGDVPASGGGTVNFLRADGVWAPPGGGTGSGDVVGPAGATDGQIALYNGATGKIIKAGGLLSDYLTAAAVAAAYQPLDSDLTAIAALSTTSFGRALLTLADTTAMRTAAGLGTLATQSGTFSGTSSGANTGDQTITLTSEASGSGIGSFAVTLANAAVIAKVLTGYAITAGGGAVAATDSILAAIQKLAGNIGGKRELANVTLGVAGASLASGAFAACKFLEVDILLEGYAGSDTASLQFNASGGTAYRYRWLTCASGAIVFAAGLAAVSTDRIKIDSTNTTLSRRIKCWISNDPSLTEKLVKFESQFATGSSATQDVISLGQGAWVSGASTSITAISLLSSSNMNAGTQMTIQGWN